MLNAARWQISRWDQISPSLPLFCPLFLWYTLQSIDHPCSCNDSRFLLFVSAIQACWETWPCDGAENERYFPPARQGRGQPIRWLTHWPAAFIGTLLPGRQEVASASHVVMIRAEINGWFQFHSLYDVPSLQILLYIVACFSVFA